LLLTTGKYGRLRVDCSGAADGLPNSPSSSAKKNIFDMGENMFKGINSCVAILAIIIGCQLPGWGAQFKGIEVGQPASHLPQEFGKDPMDRAGMYRGSFFKIYVSDNRVYMFTVIYSGKSLRGDLVSSNDMTLAAALKIHSLQASNLAPQLKRARNRDGVAYGVVDMANHIVYATMGGLATPETLLFEVTYLNADAPVLTGDMNSPLSPTESARLISAATTVRVADTPVKVITEQQLYTAPSAPYAAKLLRDQIDVVTGKARRTLALTHSVGQWYEVNKDHPKAVSETEELRRFLFDYQQEHVKLMKIFMMNERFYNSAQKREIEKLREISEEIGSKTRQLQAMGVSLDYWLIP
jgi:hypothetical protein